MNREIHCGDALQWLRQARPTAGTSVITSMPDVSEVGLALATWREWFQEAARLCFNAVPDDQGALFFQSDIKHGELWIDKAHLVHQAAEAAGARLLFHKIVARCPPGKITYGRPGYTHLLAFSRGATCPDILQIPDIIPDPGPQPWVRAVGTRAVAHAVRFARDTLKATTILDPFCGVGTIPAVANTLGLSSVGVELNKKRAAQSRELVVPETDL